MIVFDVRKCWVQSLERATAIQVVDPTIKRLDKPNMLAPQRQR